MSSFQINGSDPPAGGVPKQGGYTFHNATTRHADGLGRPTGASEPAWVELRWNRMNATAWDWYNAFFDSDEISVNLSSVRLFDLLTYDTETGASWVTYSGSNIYMTRPTVDDIEWGMFFGVTIVIRGLE